MKKSVSVAILALLVAMVSCQKQEAYISDTGYLYAQIEDQPSTRTVMDDNNNILWSEGDKIIAFMKTSLGLEYEVASSSVDKPSARFEKVDNTDDGLNAGTELNHNVAYYPYSETVDCMKSGDNYVLDVILPAEQAYAQNSFGNGSMHMVAVSEDNNITFRNVCGGIRLQLKGVMTVASIRLEGKNSELLSGAATITAYTDGSKPSITMASDASTSVTLNCGSGVQLNESTATEFIIALPPVLFSKGFTVTITDLAGNTYMMETDKENEVLRSSLLTMPGVVLGDNSVKDEYGNVFVPTEEYFVDPSAAKAAGAAMYMVSSGTYYDQYKEVGCPIIMLEYTSADTELEIKVPAAVSWFQVMKYSFSDYVTVNGLLVSETSGIIGKSVETVKVKMKPEVAINKDSIEKNYGVKLLLHKNISTQDPTIVIFCRLNVFE